MNRGKKIWSNFADYCEVLIEKVIERYNAYIQAILLIITFIVGRNKIGNNEQDMTIIIELLSLLLMEIFILHIKDSISQRKLNDMGLHISKTHGIINPGKNIKVEEFFEDINECLFVSGIAINLFVLNYKNKIIELLNRRNQVYLMFTSPEEVIENAKMYYGYDNDTSQEKKIEDILLKIQMTLSTVYNSDALLKAYREGRLKIALTNTVAPTTFVAYDIGLSKKIKQNKGVIKASFYQYKQQDASELPCILIDSKTDAEHWYPYFRKIIDEQWKEGRLIEKENELQELISQINDMIQSVRMRK